MRDFLQQTLTAQQPDEFHGENERLRWQWLSDGVIEFIPLSPASLSVVISTGIHGNETAPIEMVNSIVGMLLEGQLSLSVRLLVIFGNTRAMASDKRFNTIDLNRLFSGRHKDYSTCYETQRAQELETLVSTFYTQAPETKRWHLDLHTAIRRSYHLRFGLLPQSIDKSQDAQFMNCLLGMGLEALVLNPIIGGTFSAYTSDKLGAMSCTLELGKAKPFGMNYLPHFKAVQNTLCQCISGLMPDVNSESIPMYRVSRELTKLSDDFHFLGLGNEVKNFTRFSRGTMIAKDERTVYQVEDDHEWLIFPNPGVHKGLRAGIMLTRVPMEVVFNGRIAS